MDIQIAKVVLSKEISWTDAQKRDILYVDMKRNRVEIHASCNLEPRDYRSSVPEQDLWGQFCSDLRRYLDSKNVGLYAITCTASHTLNGQTCERYNTGGTKGNSDGAKGSIIIYFEDAGDYARFLKERAVNYKLSIY